MQRKYLFLIKKSREFEKYSNKVYEIGNIVREEIINFNNKSYDAEQFNSIKILVLGGSQAAKTFADELPYIFKK